MTVKNVLNSHVDKIVRLNRFNIAQNWIYMFNLFHTFEWYLPNVWNDWAFLISNLSFYSLSEKCVICSISKVLMYPRRIYLSNSRNDSADSVEWTIVFLSYYKYISVQSSKTHERWITWKTFVFYCSILKKSVNTVFGGFLSKIKWKKLDTKYDSTSRKITSFLFIFILSLWCLINTIHSWIFFFWVCFFKNTFQLLLDNTV